MASAARLGSRVDIGLLVACVVSSFIAVALPPDRSEPIASALRRSMVAPLVGLQRGAERWRSAWVASERRQLVADSISMRAVKATALESENQHLRKLIGLGSRMQWGFVPAEALHSTAPIPSEDVVTSLTLTAGSNAGVRKYSAVVSEDGLIGVIKSADPTMSIAILYTDADFRASAMSGDGTAFGIAYPHLAREKGGLRGAEGYMLELRGVPTRNTLAPGTAIYTSGVGGIFPRGIAIGTVVRELKTNEVWTRTYLLRPAVSPASVNAVLVLTPQRVTQGTGNLWGSVVNADSATRRIATSGDSITRAGALLEAEARKAALDSVRRATADSIRRVLGVPAGGMDSAARAAAAGRAGNAGQTAPVVRDTSAAARARRDSAAARARRDTTRARPDSVRRPPPTPETTRTPRQ